MTRHEHFDELISASLTGDLTDLEAAQLDSHLAACASCRGTVAAFTEQRRIVAGVRHVAPPRDLGARVRTGIETGAFAPLPWWRRPAVIFTGVAGGGALVAGAMLAIVLANATPEDPQVGATDDSSIPSPEIAETAQPTIAPFATQAATPLPSPPASPEVTPAPTPEPFVAAGDSGFLVFSGPVGDSQLEVAKGPSADDPVPSDPGPDDPEPTAPEPSETAVALPAPSGPPITAALSPSGEWLAYWTEGGLSGMNQLWIAQLPGGEATAIAESVAGGPFLDRLEWDDSGRYLAYSVADPDGGGVDAWVLEAAEAAPRRITDTGDTYAASWEPGGGGEASTSHLWVSRAGEQPASYLLAFHRDATSYAEPIDPAEVTDDGSIALDSAEGVFLPHVSPDGDHAIFWRGVMEQFDEGWRFVSGGMPHLSGEPVDDQAGSRISWSGEELFPTLMQGRDAMTSASVSWSRESDWFAVWNVLWTGLPQTDADGDPFPRETVVYYGRASEDRLLITPEDDTRDLELLDGEGRPVAVTFLGEQEEGVDFPLVAITVRTAAGGEVAGAPGPMALLFIVPGGTNQFGEVEPTGDEGAWNGPAVFRPTEDREPGG